MKKLILVLAILLMATAAWAQVALYGPRGEFLGYVNSNPYDPNSISNPYTYGNPYGNTIMNPYNAYGNPYSPGSTTNPYSVGPTPVRPMTPMPYRRY